MKVGKDNYLTTNLRLEEFVSRETFTKWGKRSIWFIDPRVVFLAQCFRDHFGRPIRINDWYRKGTLNQRGYRSPTTSVGGKESQHRYGRAIDFNIDGLTAQQVYDEILLNQGKFIEAGLTCLEDIDFTSTWIHADIRAHEDAGRTILIVKP